MQPGPVSPLLLDCFVALPWHHPGPTCCLFILEMAFPHESPKVLWPELLLFPLIFSKFMTPLFTHKRQSYFCNAQSSISTKLERANGCRLVVIGVPVCNRTSICKYRGISPWSRVYRDGATWHAEPSHNATQRLGSRSCKRPLHSQTKTTPRVLEGWPITCVYRCRARARPAVI